MQMNIQLREMSKAGYVGRGSELPCSSMLFLNSQLLHVFTNLRAVLWGFFRGFIM